MDPRSAYEKMLENVTVEKEDSPFDDNDEETRPFYYGLLIYKDSKGWNTFRLLNLDLFVCRAFTPSRITFRHGEIMVEYHIKTLSDWL